jgi:hypothetical protein
MKMPPSIISRHILLWGEPSPFIEFVSFALYLSHGGPLYFASEIPWQTLGSHDHCLGGKGVRLPILRLAARDPSNVWMIVSLHGLHNSHNITT